MRLEALTVSFPFVFELPLPASGGFLSDGFFCRGSILHDNFLWQSWLLLPKNGPAVRASDQDGAESSTATEVAALDMGGNIRGNPTAPVAPLFAVFILDV